MSHVSIHVMMAAAAAAVEGAVVFVLFGHHLLTVGVAVEEEVLGDDSYLL